MMEAFEGSRVLKTHRRIKLKTPNKEASVDKADSSSSYWGKLSSQWGFLLAVCHVSEQQMVLQGNWKTDEAQRTCIRTGKEK